MRSGCGAGRAPQHGRLALRARAVPRRQGRGTRSRAPPPLHRPPRARQPRPRLPRRLPDRAGRARGRGHAGGGAMKRGGPMKTFYRLVVFGCAALLAALPVLAADREAVLKAAREVARKARYATFITIGEDGQPQARIVDALGPDEDFNVWVGEKPGAGKVAEIAKNPRVTPAVFDPSLHTRGAAAVG